LSDPVWLGDGPPVIWIMDPRLLDSLAADTLLTRPRDAPTGAGLRANPQLPKLGVTGSSPVPPI
jgi:hypothetical protein